MEESTKDPQKAKQIDRLGLGLGAIGGSGGKSGVSHSITSGIRTIQQDDLAATKTAGFGRKGGRDFFGGGGISEDWEIVDEEERSTTMASRNKFGIDDFFRWICLG